MKLFQILRPLCPGNGHETEKDLKLIMHPTKIIIGITGGSGCGKTTLAQRIHRHFTREDGSCPVGLLCLDSYYRSRDDLSFEERAKLNYDCPEAFDFDLLCRHLEQLKAGESIDCPVYDYGNHTRADHTIRIEPAEVLLLEGILLFCHPKLRELINLKIYIDTDADVRLLRRIRRDMAERGRTLDSIASQYFGTVKPMHERYIAPSRRYADIILQTDADNSIPFSLLTGHINSFITSEDPTLA